MLLKHQVKQQGRQRVHPRGNCRLTIDAERASREAIQRKCEKLEEIVEVRHVLV